MSTEEPKSDKENEKIKVLIAIIALVGTLGAGVLTNWNSIFPIKPSPLTSDLPINPISSPPLSPSKFDEFFKKASELEKMALKLTPETGIGLTEENLSKSTQHWQNAIRLVQQISSSDPTNVIADETLVKYRGNLSYTEALKFGFIAAKLTTKAGEKNVSSIEEWQNIEKLWGKALTKLKEIEPTDPNYTSANEKISEYKNKLAYAGQAKLIANFLQGSRKATEAENLTRSAESQDDWLQIAGLWKQSIDLMKNVPKGSRSSSEAQKNVKDYQSKLLYAQEKATKLQ
jgi:hypothetical protein